MRFITALALSLLLSLPVFAQVAPTEGNVRFKKADRNGVTAEYDAPKGETEDALANRLKGAKLGKRHSEGGYWKYEGVTWPEMAAMTIDVYFNVETHKGKSVVYMLVSPGNENFVSSATNPQIIQNMKTFLAGFNADIVAWQQQVALEAQQKAVADANKDLKNADKNESRAARRQREADKKKEEMQHQADEEKKKLDDLQKGK